MTAPDLSPADWQPQFFDYLYLSFTNAAAFSPTDTLPLVSWAKLAMMLQSSRVTRHGRAGRRSRCQHLEVNACRGWRLPRCRHPAAAMEPVRRGDRSRHCPDRELMATIPRMMATMPNARDTGSNRWVFTAAPRWRLLWVHVMNTVDDGAGGASKVTSAVDHEAAGADDASIGQNHRTIFELNRAVGALLDDRDRVGAVGLDPGAVAETDRAVLVQHGAVAEELPSRNIGDREEGRNRSREVDERNVGQRGSSHVDFSEADSKPQLDQVFSVGLVVEDQASPIAAAAEPRHRWPQAPLGRRSAPGRRRERSP